MVFHIAQIQTVKNPASRLRENMSLLSFVEVTGQHLSVYLEIFDVEWSMDFHYDRYIMVVQLWDSDVRKALTWWRESSVLPK